MKFLCVPCDTPMTLQAVGPPDRGSLSIVYSCPECGYEIAMLTNAYETQAVQSLGVRIGPAADPAASNTPGASCPFTAMIPSNPYEGSRDLASASEGERVSHANGAGPGASASERAGGAGAAKPSGLTWTAAAEARLANVPEFVRPMARTGIERFARERGASEVDEQMLDAAREFFGM
jgi:Proto-chlorophyllide reductase 57 kD subunit